MKKQLLSATASPYALALTKWPKAAGPMPTDIEFATIHAMNIRPGCKHALACAMYHREGGATDSEVIAAARLLDANPKGRQGVLHNYAFDKKLGLCGAIGLMSRDVTVAPRDGAKVYKINLTKKGQALRDKWLAANPLPAAPVAPVAKAKPQRKAKAKPVSEPVSEPVSDGSVLIPAAPVSDAVEQPQG